MHRGEQFEGCSTKQQRTGVLAASRSDGLDPRARAQDGVTKHDRLRMHGRRAARCMQVRLAHELLFERQLCDTIDAKAMRRNCREIDLERGMHDA